MTGIPDFSPARATSLGTTVEVGVHFFVTNLNLQYYVTQINTSQTGEFQKQINIRFGTVGEGRIKRKCPAI